MPLQKGNTESVSDESIDFVFPANRYLKVLKEWGCEGQGLGGGWRLSYKNRNSVMCLA